MLEHQEELIRAVDQKIAQSTLREARAWLGLLMVSTTCSTAGEC
jgi:hypothetical protein